MKSTNATVFYYTSFIFKPILKRFLYRNDLKVTHPTQLKFATDSDLAELGMSKPEVRRLRKYYEKHFPNNYLSKFKKLLSARRHENVCPDPTTTNGVDDRISTVRVPRMPSKHIIPATNITVNKELGMGEFGVVQQGVWSNEGERIQVCKYYLITLQTSSQFVKMNRSIVCRGSFSPLHCNSCSVA